MSIYKQVGGNRGTIPKKWKFKDGSTTGNFDLMPESVHNDEGWFKCSEDPIQLNIDIEKFGDDYLDNKVWKRDIIKLSSDELLVKEEQKITEDWILSDREFTVRMFEDGMRIMKGETTFEQLKSANGGKSIPLEIWLDDRKIKPGRK